MQLSLNGADWKVKDYYGEDWRWRDSHISVRYDAGAWYPANVPGTIAHDLLTAGEIPSPYYERDSRLIEWIPARTWVYRKTFTLDETLTGQRAQLRFEGIDYAAQIFLNGQDIGAHVCMYTPATFDVGHLLKYGDDEENVLGVVIAPAPHEEPQVGRTSRVRTHKSRMTYWWDFCPRMVHQGLWDDVTLTFTGAIRFDDVFVRPQLNDDFTQANVIVTAQLDAQAADDVRITATIRDSEQVVAQQTVTVAGDQSHVTLTLPVNQPRLWYPNGNGQQPLYTAEVQVSVAGDISDQHITRFGIRHINLIPNQTDDPTARPYTLVVNGQRTYIKGWNWVPIDAMYGVPRPDKLRRLLTLAQRAHVNMLRIWGGGLIEKTAFYDLCDELGILVWQEFAQSSSGIDNNPPTDPDFIAQLVNEAEQIIPRRRNHPSLVIWCGGNELTGDGDKPLDNDHPMLGALGAAVNRLDPDRIWLPTSPTGRVFGNTLAHIERDPTALHDVHGPWEYQGVNEHYMLYNRGSSLLHSEFGVEGLTNLKSLNATIAPENQFPVTLKNPIWHHLGAWWVKETMWRATFGDVANIAQLVRATQLMQADGLRYALESDRYRKYQSSGTLPWQFNEPFPMGACTSAVDYYQQPKPVYYGVAHAYEPVHVSAKFDTVAWANRDTFSATVRANSSLRHEISAVAHMRLIDSHGHIVAQAQTPVTLPPDSATVITDFSHALVDIATDVFFLDLTLTDANGERLSHNRYCHTRAENLSPLLHVPQTTLTVTRERAGDTETLTVTNTGDTVALYVWLEDARPVNTMGYAFFSDNHFCLLPDETRTITITWEMTPTADRQLTVQGWNTATD